MAIKISDVKSGTQTVKVEWDGEQASVEYSPTAFTPGMIHDLASEEDVIQVVELLDALLVSWDVLDDDGAALPTDKETLMGMPFTFLVRVMETVRKDMQPSGEASGSFGPG